MSNERIPTEQEREVGGIRCMQVLEVLDDFVEGTMAAELEARVTAHVAECSNCASFGARYAATIATMRSSASAAAPGLRERVLRTIL